MEPSMKTVYQLYCSTDKFVAEILNYLNEDQLNHTVGSNGNSTIRLYAHVCVVRNRLLNKLTGSCEALSFEDSAGGFPSDNDVLPPLEEINAAYSEVSKKLYDCFSGLNAEQLQAGGLGDDEFITDDKTLLGSLAFLGYHEGYTVGQMGFLGRAQGALPEHGHLG